MPKVTFNRKLELQLIRTSEGFRVRRLRVEGLGQVTFLPWLSWEQAFSISRADHQDQGVLIPLNPARATNVFWGLGFYGLGFRARAPETYTLELSSSPLQAVVPGWGV